MNDAVGRGGIHNLSEHGKGGGIEREGKGSCFTGSGKDTAEAAIVGGAGGVEVSSVVMNEEHLRGGSGEADGMKVGQRKKDLLRSRCFIGCDGAGTGRNGIAKLEDQFAGKALEGEGFTDLVVGDPDGAAAKVNFSEADTAEGTGELNGGMEEGLRWCE